MSHFVDICIERRRRPQRIAGFFAAVFALAFLNGPAARAQDDDGEFVVRSAMSERGTDSDGSAVYYVTAWIDYRLSDEVRDALENGGVTLRIETKIELVHKRRFWFDNDDYPLVLDFELEYNDVTQRYILRNLNTSEQFNFTTLFSALNKLGRIERIPFIDVSVLEPDRVYDVRLRSELDADRLTGPMRLLAFWRRDFSLGSEWYQWPLEGE